MDLNWRWALLAIPAVFSVWCVLPDTGGEVRPRAPVVVAVPLVEVEDDAGSQVVGGEVASPAEPASPTAEQQAFYEDIGQLIGEAEHYCGRRVGFACAGEACAHLAPVEARWMSLVRRPRVYIDEAVVFFAGLPEDAAPCTRASRKVFGKDAIWDIGVYEGMRCVGHLRPGVGRSRDHLDDLRAACTAAAADVQR